MLRRVSSASGFEPSAPHRRFEILRHHRLHLVAIHADQVAQEIDRQQGFAARFLVHDDLREDIMRDVFAAFRIDDAEIAAVADHRAEIVERDIATAFGIVEPPVGVFLDRDDVTFRRPLGLRHFSPALPESRNHGDRAAPDRPWH